MRVMLGNIDYEHHMTDEGNQLQRGLEYAGWHLSGVGFDGMQDCSEIIRKYAPETILVHDKRDWDPKNYWAFRRDIGFSNLEAVKFTPNRLGVVKDAGSMVEYHRYFCEDEINCTGVVTYYHDRAVLPHNLWMEKYPRFRTYHTVNSDFLRATCRWTENKRRDAVLTGASNRQVYPLRAKCSENAGFLGIDLIGHPGYHNSGTRTGMYLELLHSYKVHIATASVYGFALRKIIESVAAGCTPITDLPEWDCLPEIDEALVRVPPDISMEDMQYVIYGAVKNWDREERLFYAGRCAVFYDYRNMGLRLDKMIKEGVCESKSLA